MQTLEKNVTNIWGKKGKIWLSRVSATITALSKRWLLTDIRPVKNMNHNYVALAIHRNNIPVVLKISCDSKLIQDEYRALQYFNGQGAVKVIDIDSEHNALLLEQAVPGNILKENYPLNLEDTITTYSHLVKSLARFQLPGGEYTHVREWCDVIDQITDQRIDKKLVDKTKELKTKLLNSIEQAYLCHGDLHLENIIKQGSAWVAIDPKGIMGEIAFEAAAFDLISKDEMVDSENIASKITERVTKLATSLDLDYERLLSWIFLRLIISAQWFVEDKGDPTQMLVLASYVYGLLNSTKIEILAAALDKYPVIQNMARFYVYDMSEYMGWEIPADGLYECMDFKHYWTEVDTFPFLIYVDDELAGFVIVNKQGNSIETDYNMTQFFILRKFKNKHIGKQVAYECFNRFSGIWEVMVMPGNTGAYQFWRTIITEYTNNNYKEQMCNIAYLDNAERNLFRFNSKL